MGLAGTLWDFLGLYGAVWDCLGLSGTSGTLHFLPIPDKSTFVEKISHTGPRKKNQVFPKSSIFNSVCQKLRFGSGMMQIVTPSVFC